MEEGNGNEEPVNPLNCVTDKHRSGRNAPVFRKPKRMQHDETGS